VANDDARSARNRLTARLFPEGIPRLWCPLLTHFAAARQPDEERIRAHLAAVSPWAKGLLIPGSTGEGWKMTDEEVLHLLSIVLPAAERTGTAVLVGVLRTELEATLACIDFLSRALAGDARGVVGFTVCPPAGQDLTQQQIRDALARVLDRGHPTALYQLPQVTRNEMSPATVAELARHCPNFYLLKDTSGRDRVVQSGADLGGVFLVRGAEGAYADWLKAAGGPYDGFLLGSANAFAREFSTVIDLTQQGRLPEARALSQRVQRVAEACAAVADGLPVGSPFASVNKALDHVFAFGPGAADVAPPMLRSGERLPRELIERSAELLRAEGLLPARGYLSG
jgi:dihydrodipicolinate synthase/N-acetylneuraminate lyase